MESSLAIPKEPFRFLLHISRQFRYVALGAITAVCIATTLESSVHYIVKLLIDSFHEAIQQQNLDNPDLWRWGIVFPSLVFLTSLCWRTSGFCGQRWLTGLEAATYRTLFDYLVGHSTAYFQNRFAGSLSNKISNAASGALQLLAISLWQFTPLVIGFVTNGVVAYLAHPLIAAVFAGWLVIFVVANLSVMRSLSRLSYKSASASSELKGKIVDTSTNITSVQQGGHIRYEQRYVGRYVNTYRTAHLRSWYIAEWVLIMNNFLVFVFIASMIGTAIYLVSTTEISLGSVAMVITLVGSMQSSLTFICMTATQAVRYYGQVKEGLDELLLPHEIVDRPGAAPLHGSVKGEIDIDRIEFAYGDGSKVFSEFSLKIPAGQKVGVVGPSGAGKSTLVAILLRQYEAQSGSVAIDGQSIRSVTLESLGKNISLVPQDMTLFHRKISENIQYGNLEASLDEIRQAAKLAQADEFISELPDGYDTYVGERGVKLSGGQRQRVAIARAFLKNAPILVLDEATSSLDSESEQAVQKALVELFQGRTVIAIAHRLSTLRAMDRIIVLHEGKIVEDGTHQQLLNEQGLYAKLWNSQVEGFIS